jgi:hypothetical protein
MPKNSLMRGTYPLHLRVLVFPFVPQAGCSGARSAAGLLIRPIQAFCT